MSRMDRIRRRKTIGMRLWSAVRHLLLAGAGLIAAAAACGYLYGIPAPLARFVLQRASSGHYVVQADRLALHGLGVRLQGVRIYRKGVPGLPGVECRLAEAGFSPLLWLSGFDGIHHVTMTDAEFRLRQLQREELRTPERKSRPSRFTFRLLDSQVSGVPFAHCSGTILMDGLRSEIPAFTVRFSEDPRSGFASGSMLADWRERLVTGSVLLQLDPKRLFPLIEAFDMRTLQRVINRFAFAAHAPRIEADFRYAPDHSDLVVDGTFRMREFALQGVAVDRAEGTVLLTHSDTNSVVAIDHLNLYRPEGRADGWVTVDTESHRATFDIRSTLHPAAMAGMVGIGEDFLNRRFHFAGPVTSAFRGYADYETLTDTEWRGTVSASDVSLGPVLCDQISFAAAMTGSTLSLSDIDATLLGGQVAGTFACEVPPPANHDAPVPFTLDIALADLDFQQVMAVRSEAAPADISGALNGVLRVSGIFEETLIWDSLDGVGRLSVRRGRVFMLPLFGGLSNLLAGIIPGLDFVLRQGDARAIFSIDGGRVLLDRLMIEGDVLSLSAKGSVTLPEQVNLDVQVRLLKEHTLVARLLRVITYPISKLFEFRVVGTVSDPVWYPVNFSTDLLDRIGGGRAPADQPRSLQGDGSDGGE